MKQLLLTGSSAIITGLLAAGIAWFWYVTGTPGADALRYAIGWLWTITLPGCLLARLAFKPQPDLLSELTVGSAIGLIVSTYIWLLLVAVAGQAWFVAWPLLPLAGSLVLPRRVFRLTPKRLGVHPATLAGISCVIILAIAQFTKSGFATTHFPPRDNAWYPDDYWHLALIHELERAMPPSDPQVSGGAFWYHWFANAHIAAQAHASHVDPLVAFARLWAPFILVTTFALILVAARELTGRYWPGVIAATAMVFPGIRFTWFNALGSGINVHSPSQQWVYVPLLLCIIAVIRLLRTNERVASLMLFSIGGLGCMGGKSSALPVLICGLALAVVVSFWLDRSRTVWLGLFTGISIGLFSLSMVFTSQASAGARIQLFSSMRMLPPWTRHAGKQAVSLDPIIPGLDLAGGSKLLGLLLVCLLVIRGSWALAAPLLKRHVAAWFLLGVSVAGFSAMMLVNQDGMSQIYFFAGVVPALGLLTAAGVRASWQRAAQHIESLPTLIGVAAASAGTAWLVTYWTRSLSPSSLEGPQSNVMVTASLGIFVFAAVAVPVAVSALFQGAGWLAASSFVTASTLPLSAFGKIAPGSCLHVVLPSAVVIIGVAILLFRQNYEEAIRKLVVVAVTLALMGAGYQSFTTAVEAVEEVLTESPRTYSVSTGEAKAAIWVREHTEEDALLATNVHCVSPPEKDHCIVKGFWVSALTSRRVLLGAWAYTPEAHAAQGVGGAPSTRQPYHDQALYELNQAAFTNPTRETMNQLRARGVRYLYASTRYTTISDKLGAFAKEVHRSGDAIIYSLG